MATAADRQAKIGVLGASGYTGAELVRLLLRHPRAEIALLTADRRAGQEMRQVFPQFAPFALPRLQSIEGMDWARRRARSDLLRLAARHHAEGDQADPQRRCPRSGSSTSRPTSGSPTPPPMRAGTGTSIMRRSCSGRRCTAWSRSIATQIRHAQLVANPGCYTTCAQLRAHSAAAGQDHRSRRDRDRCQVRHDRRRQGGEGGDAVLRGVGRLPRLRRRPPPSHGRARPGILAWRRGARSSSASRRIWCP